MHLNEGATFSISKLCPCDRMKEATVYYVRKCPFAKALGKHWNDQLGKWFNMWLTKGSKTSELLSFESLFAFPSAGMFALYIRQRKYNNIYLICLFCKKLYVLHSLILFAEGKLVSVLSSTWWKDSFLPQGFCSAVKVWHGFLRTWQNNTGDWLAKWLYAVVPNSTPWGHSGHLPNPNGTGGDIIARCCRANWVQLAGPTDQKGLSYDRWEASNMGNVGQGEAREGKVGVWE